MKTILCGKKEGGYSLKGGKLCHNSVLPKYCIIIECSSEELAQRMTNENGIDRMIDTFHSRIPHSWVHKDEEMSYESAKQFLEGLVIKFDKVGRYRWVEDEKCLYRGNNIVYHGRCDSLTIGSVSYKIRPYVISIDSINTTSQFIKYLNGISMDDNPYVDIAGWREIAQSLGLIEPSDAGSPIWYGDPRTHECIVTCDAFNDNGHSYYSIEYLDDEQWDAIFKD